MNKQTSSLESKQSRRRMERLMQTERGEEKRQGREAGRVSYSHLQVRDELSHSDFLCYLLVQALAIQDHALQDGQGPLKDGHIHHGLAHVPCNLKAERDKSVRRLRAQGAGRLRLLLLAHRLSPLRCADHIGAGILSWRVLSVCGYLGQFQGFPRHGKLNFKLQYPFNGMSSKSKGLILHFQNKDSGVKKLSMESRGSY